MDTGDDQRVIAAVLAGETEAYAVLAERCQKPIYNLMVRMTGSTRDALYPAQETFIKALEQSTVLGGKRPRHLPTAMRPTPAASRRPLHYRKQEALL